MAGIDTGRVLVDIDDSIIEVHGHGKQGSGYGYSGVRGLNALIATVTTDTCAPVIVGQRLRRGACGSPRGAARMVTDALATVDRLRTHSTESAAEPTPKVLVRLDSAFYGHPTLGRRDRSRSRRLGHRAPDHNHQASDRIDRRRQRLDADRIHRRDLRRGHRHLDLACGGRRNTDFTAFASQRKAHRIPGRLVVRRIPDLRPKKDQDQGTLFDIWRFHAFSATTDPTDLDTVAADKLHRHHAIVEQVHADLKNSALAHLPSGRFTANAAWLVCAVMAFNLTRAAGTLTDDPKLVKATTGTIRRTIVSVPARIASSARRLTLHLPQHWPWETAWNTLFDCMFGRNQPIIA